MVKKLRVLIKFGIMFYDEDCILRRFRSPLRAMKSFSFGFQPDKSKIYSFDELTTIISGRKYSYGSRLGLFVQNNQTRKQGQFNFDIPPLHPDAQANITVFDNGYEMDITRILARISHA